MSIKGLLIIGISTLGLAACGDTTGERALFGAGAGALTAEAFDGDPLVGAGVGAVANVAYCKKYPQRC